MRVWAIVLENPDRVYQTYRTEGAAKGAITQKGWKTGYRIIPFVPEV